MLDPSSVWSETRCVPLMMMVSGGTEFGKFPSLDLLWNADQVAGHMAILDFRGAQVKLLSPTKLQAETQADS